MRTVAIATRAAVRLLGVVEIVLGLLFWFGAARTLVPLHMVLGVLIVLALWLLATVGARARVGTGLVIVAFAWGLVLVAVGMGQLQWIPGAWHWLIQLLHLLIGIGAIGLAEGIGGRLKRGTAAAIR